eukprot:c18152_g1_i1 orf=381-1571(-)
MLSNAVLSPQKFAIHAPDASQFGCAASLHAVNLLPSAQTCCICNRFVARTRRRCEIRATSGISTVINEKVRLGASDLEVTKLGIGAWSWGDKFFWNEGSWDDRKMKDAKAAFDASVDSGITFFDTAEVYGSKIFGGEDSERLLGRFINERQKRDSSKVVVATKFAALPWRFGRSVLVSALKASLNRLGLSSVDLYQLHWPGLWGNEGYIDGLADAVEQGLVKAVGVSNYNERRLRSAHDQLKKRCVPLASNQVHYNLMYRAPEQNGVKAACQELGVTLIAYSPIAQGVLSGKYTPERLPSGPRSQIYNREFLSKAIPLFEKLKEIGKRRGKTPTQISLNWLLSQGNVVPIPGAKTAAQVQEFSGALGWNLTADEVDELRQVASTVDPVQGFPVELF